MDPAICLEKAQCKSGNMSELPMDMAGLNLEGMTLNKNTTSDSPPPASDSEEVVTNSRVLRKRTNEPTISPNTAPKRRCLQVPQKKETLSQIKKIYLNKSMKTACDKNLETIFESVESENGETLLGKQKIRRSITFLEVANKSKQKHRQKMVKRLEVTVGHKAFRPRKCKKASISTVLDRLIDNLSGQSGNEEDAPLDDPPLNGMDMS